MDLVKLIISKVQEIETSGKLDEIIEKNVLDVLNEIVHDSFSWNGVAKKSIEDALKDKLGVSLGNVKIPQYQKLVSDIVNKQLNNTVAADLQHNIETVINSFTESLEKKEWKLSEIITEFISCIDKSYDGEMDDQYGCCSLHINNDGAFCHIYFDKDEDVEKYQCKQHLFIYKNKLSSATIDEVPFSPFNMRLIGDFTRFMFNLYCNNVTIIVDEADCNLEYYRDDNGL